MIEYDCCPYQLYEIGAEKGETAETQVMERSGY